MAKSLSELFGNGDIIKLPKNQGQQYDPITRSGSWVESGGASAYDKDTVDNAWKILGNVLGHYPHYTKTPQAALKLFGGAVGINTGEIGSTIDNVTSALGAGSVFGGQSGVVPIPPYMSYEDGQLVNWAVNTIIGAVRSANGNLPRPNYELIFKSITSSDILNKAINKLTGDYLKMEFEKGRWPARLAPYYNETSDFYTGAYYRKKTQSEPTTILGTISQSINNTIDNILGNNPNYSKEIEGWKIIDNNVPILGYDDYRNFGYGRLDDPYGESIDLRQRTTDYKGGKNIESIGEAINYLRENNLLSGYEDFAGFEMGTNHQWYINIYPYPHDEDDISAYSEMKRNSVTPALPVYALPNMWRERKAKAPSEYSGESSVPMPSKEGLSLSNVVSQFKNDIKYEAIEYVTKKLIAVFEGVNEYDGDGFEQAKASKEDLLAAIHDEYRTYMSFSTKTPVLSYDLNFGTIKTDSLKLFNGSQSEIFMGMNYNPVMNISILDDVYCSMFKYMQQYINCAYDISTHSLAPYYNCAFQIELVIMRAGGNINHKFKFIGIPIEYTPRLEGQSEPNECRVDITFSIIGFKPYTNGSKLYDNNMGGRSIEKDPTDPLAKRKNDLGQLTWDDIQIKLS